MHIEGLEGYASIFSPFFGTNQRTDAEEGKNRDDWPKKSHFGSDIQNETTGGTNMARPSSAGELDAVALETALLEQWKQESAFQASIESRRNGAPFIFL